MSQARIEQLRETHAIARHFHTRPESGSDLILPECIAAIVPRVTSATSSSSVGNVLMPLSARM
jgi:hypothetical protein